MKILFFPRKYGFCGGVIRAISMIERALKKYSPPIYVHHPIVHNEHVVLYFEEKGVIFVNDLSEIPKTENPVFLSAHGSPKILFEEAEKLNLKVIDCVCPLVKKLHEFVREKNKLNYKIILIGSKKNHKENIGTLGQISSPIFFINKVEDIKNIPFLKTEKLCFATQTTLSINETKKIIEKLKSSYPNIEGMTEGNICRATTERQLGLNKIIKNNKLNTVLVVGSKTSSNTKNLVLTAKSAGANSVFLITKTSDMTKKMLNEAKIGITAGASTPQSLINRILEKIKTFDKIEIKKGK